MVKRPDGHQNGDFHNSPTFTNGSSNELLTFGGVFPSYGLLSSPIRDILESLQMIISSCRLLETPLQLHHWPISLASSTIPKINQPFLESVAELLFEGVSSVQAPRITLKLTLDPSLAQDIYQACREHMHEDTAIFISTLEANLVREPMGTHLQLTAEAASAAALVPSSSTCQDMPFHAALRSVNGSYHFVCDEENCAQELIFFVPYMRGDIAASTQHALQTTRPSSFRPRILVVEDNALTLSFITYLLHSRGYDVSIASSEVDMSILLKTITSTSNNNELQLQYAAILINTTLPFAYSSSSRLLQAGECLIGMTIHHNEESIREALEHGYHALLSKPFDVDDFEDVFTFLTSN